MLKIVYARLLKSLVECSSYMSPAILSIYPHTTRKHCINIPSLVRQMDNGIYTSIFTIDLQKSLDTLKHSLLSDKLRILVLNDISVSWFDSYLMNRTQSVDINGTFSKPRLVPCGVPRGSIPDPLLFLIYVNDMEYAVKCKLILSTDDSALLASGKYLNPYNPEIFFNKPWRAIFFNLKSS